MRGIKLKTEVKANLKLYNWVGIKHFWHFLVKLCFLRRPQNLTKSTPSIWHYIVSVKLTVKILSIFVAFFENLNFKDFSIYRFWVQSGLNSSAYKVYLYVLQTNKLCTQLTTKFFLYFLSLSIYCFVYSIGQEISKEIWLPEIFLGFNELNFFKKPTKFFNISALASRMGQIKRDKRKFLS